MQQNSVQLVTYIASEEPFAWGLQLDRIGVPLCVYCPAAFYETLLTKPRSAFVEIIAAPAPESPASLEKIALLHAVAEEKKAEISRFYWLEISFLQAYLSFSLLHSPLLTNWLATFPDSLLTFEFPALEAGVLWGGSEADLFALKAHCRVLNDLLFSPAADPGAIAAEIHGSFRKLTFKEHQPNLEIAGALQKPVLHLIADEEIFYGFTPLAAIGCRNHVLTEQTPEHDFSAAFPYRFSHHVGQLSICQADPLLTTDFLEKLQVKAGDLVIFGSGSRDLEVDVELAAEFYAGAEEWVQQYVTRIASLATELNFRAAIFEIPPPANLAGDEENARLSEEKTRRTQYLNQLLQKWGGFLAIPVCRLYQQLATLEGYLAPEKSDGYKYIAPEIAETLLRAFGNELIQEYIENAILD